jgi:predicted ATPase
VATWRPQDTSAEPALKALRQDLLLRRLCVEVPLAPFGRAHVASLLRFHLGQDALPPGLEEFVYEHSEGNPLFVIAMLEHLIAQRYLVREPAREPLPPAVGDAARWRLAMPLADMGAGVPDELAQMIELEVERLTPQDQRLLEAASLMPVAFPAWAVAAALSEDPADIEEACDELARRLYFVRRAGQDELPDGSRTAFYTFTHGLYRDVLYERQAAARRARRHLRIADRLAQLFAGREHNVARELAQHYEAAGEWRRAVQALRSAAQGAVQRNAHPEASALLDSACAVAANLGDDERSRLLAELRAQQADLGPQDAVETSESANR